MNRQFFLKSLIAGVPPFFGNMYPSNPQVIKYQNQVENIINSISDLRNDTINSNIIELLGYYKPGDGGGGFFYWDQNSTEKDDGGTILKNKNKATGRWKRLIDSNYINVRWFGAKGNWNGQTGNDDTESFLNAIKALKTYGNLIIPDYSDYLITKPLIISKNYVSIHLGNAQIIAKNTGSSAIQLGNGNGNAFIQLWGGRIKLLGTTLIGIEANYVTNLNISHSLISGDDQDSKTAIKVTSGSYLSTIKGIRTNNLQKGLYIEDGKFMPNSLTIENCWFKVTGDQSVSIHNNSKARKIKIRECYLEGSEFIGLYIQKGHVHIEDIYIEAHGGSWGQIDSDDNVIELFEGIGGKNGIQVKGKRCILKASYSDGFPSSGHYIEILSEAENTLILSNHPGRINDKGIKTIIIDQQASGSVKNVGSFEIQSKLGYNQKFPFFFSIGAANQSNVDKGKVYQYRLDLEGNANGHDAVLKQFINGESPREIFRIKKNGKIAMNGQVHADSFHIGETQVIGSQKEAIQKLKLLLATNTNGQLNPVEGTGDDKTINKNLNEIHNKLNSIIDVLGKTKGHGLTSD